MNILADKKQNIKGFNIRVYGIFIHDQHLLLSDEFRMNTKMTKFPGGGLKPGESTVNCLKRECFEEMGQEVIIGDHYYTTDYFQPTLLLPEVYQLISIYYFIQIEPPFRFKISDKQYDFKKTIEGAQSFRWIHLNAITEDDVTFPIDKLVVEKLLSLPA